ncbi:hypothetical protein [Hymenobacter glacieicola]|uniref:hypothetical protein n=1 Tax=Hymenobacter glacieicola TaxID=1562124 RepID=UPI00166D2904|nr:hypothetical protein [Hymenobacter glacieicola]
MKAVCVLYQLKSLYVGGVVWNFSREAKAIANTFGYSEGKLRQYLSYIIKRGWASKRGRHTLVLRSRRVLTQEFGVSQYCHKVSTDHLYRLEEELTKLAVQENLGRQQHVIDTRLQDEYLAHNGKKRSSHLQPAARRRILRGFDLAAAQTSAKARYTAQVRTKSEVGVLNPFATLSRSGVARVFGRKSKAAGLRRVQKLKQHGLLSDCPHYVVIRPITLVEFKAMQRYAGGSHGAYRFYNGNLLKQLPNLLTVPSN